MKPARSSILLGEAFDPEEINKLADEYYQACQRYRECKWQKLIFENRSKDFLAALKHKFAEKENKSDAELERLARSSEEWKAFREEQMKLLKEAGRREIDYREAQVKLDLARSILAMRREEIKRFPT